LVLDTLVKNGKKCGKSTFDYDAFSADLMSSKQNLTRSFMTFLLGKYISTANKNVSEHRRVSEEDI
jgi:hypothetical protein